MKRKSDLDLKEYSRLIGRIADLEGSLMRHYDAVRDIELRQRKKQLDDLYHTSPTTEE